MILVTGATGLLGGHLVDLLLERGESVRALVRPGDDATRLARIGAQVCEGDLGDETALAAAVAGAERVLHCAARTGPWGPESEYQTANVRGVELLVDAAMRAGVERIVHVSSITVHGNDVRGAASESTPFHLEPNPYTRTKIAGEQLLDRLIADRQAPVTVVRPGWIYGPRDRASFARFAAMTRAGKMVVIGSGKNHVPLIYVTDVAEGILLASQAPGAVGRAYLLVNDEPVTQSQYLGAIAAEQGVAAPTRHIPYRLALALGATAETVGHLASFDRPPPLMRYGIQLLGGENRFEIGRARQELGFVPQVSMADGVRRSIEWLRAEELADTTDTNG